MRVDDKTAAEIERILASDDMGDEDTDVVLGSVPDFINDREEAIGLLRRAHKQMRDDSHGKGSGCGLCDFTRDVEAFLASAEGAKEGSGNG